MRKAMIAALAAFLGMSTAAYAADLGGSAKDAPVYDVASKSWTGLYIGGGIGGGASVTDLTVNSYEYGHEGESYKYIENESSFGFDGIGGEGIFGTVQLGYDYQLSQRFVIGAFIDYDFSNISTDIEFSNGYDSYKTEIELDHMWSVGGRFGWLATPDTLWYALVAYTEGNYSGDDFGIDLDVKGLTLGGGVETRLTENWSLKAEYRYTQFDSENLFSEESYCHGLSVDVEPSVHTARLTLNYRINPFERSLESYK